MSVNMTALKSAADGAVTRAQSDSAALDQVVEGRKKAFTELADLKPMKNPATAVNKVGGAILGVANMGAELTNTGVAVMTNSIAAALPAFPAAHLTSFYLGIPHAHAHPPSLVPPAPPVPLPTMGMITLGTSVQVLIQNKPAARAGDLGLAPTCGGLAPFFTVFLASSKVFIGGMRAARQTDMCTACTPSKDAATRATATAMKAASKAAMAANMARAAVEGIQTLGKVVAYAGIAGSAIDAVQAKQASQAATEKANDAHSEADQAAAEAEAQEQAALVEANAMNAGSALAQMAVDTATAALSATMGMDPAIPPGMIGFVTQGAPNVLIGGMPMPNIPDPAQWLLKKLAAKATPRPPKAKGVGGGAGCS